MLSGPTGSGDYFDSHLRGGFPTPNESSLRTGLTPGGGGSMFPAPSPNSQALYQQLAGGGATPNTLDFHRTAMSAAAARKTDNQNTLNGANPQQQDSRAQAANMDQAPQQQVPQQHFGQHDNDAANGLFLLAQATNESQPNNQFAVPTQTAQGMAASNQTQGSPSLAKKAARNATGSIGGSISGSARGMSELSNDVSEGESKPNTRNKGKRTSTGKGVANGRRKADEAPTKQPAPKKARASNGAAISNMNDMDMDGMDSDDGPDMKEDQYHENGKKMTDEEKRKNFLERNRSVVFFVSI